MSRTAALEYPCGPASLLDKCLNQVSQNINESHFSETALAALPKELRDKILYLCKLNGTFSFFFFL
jgi:hypothetical protein